MPTRPERPRGLTSPARALVLAATLALAAPLTGCFGIGDSGPPIVKPDDFKDGPRSERPSETDYPTSAVTEAAQQASAPATPDPSMDPRLNLTKPWHRGDKWYYESNRSRFMRVTVQAIKVYRGVPYYQMKTEYGDIGLGTDATLVSTITRDFRTVNMTTPTGFRTFNPPDPGLRFLPRDNSYSYNETFYQRTAQGGVVTTKRFFSVHAREDFPLYPVKVPAGTFHASLTSVFSAWCNLGSCDNKHLHLNETERWYSPDVLNDVWIRTDITHKQIEEYQLVYAVVAGKYVGLRLDYER